LTRGKRLPAARWCRLGCSLVVVVTTAAAVLDKVFDESLAVLQNPLKRRAVFTYGLAFNAR
jgi:hypothetical protein